KIYDHSFIANHNRSRDTGERARRFSSAVVDGRARAGQKDRHPPHTEAGLALAGFAHYIHSGRVQIVGQSEIQYLEQLSTEQRRDAIGRLPLGQIAAVLITKNLVPPDEFLRQAKDAELPVLITPEVSSIAIIKLTDFLQQRLAPCITLHGVMLDL